MAAGRPNTQHRRIDEERTVPLIASDYAYIRDSRDQSLLTILVAKVVPYGVVLAMAQDHKGVTNDNVERASNWLKDIGLTKFVVKSDQEPSIIALFEAAALATGRKMEEEAVVATPERSSVGESASNGLAKRAVQSVEDIVRTCKLALEARISARIPSASPIMHWMVEHAASLLTKYHVGSDGRTGYARLHGRETKEKLVEFGETIMWFVPRKLRAKLDARWRYGIWLGRALNSDDNYIGTRNGDVVRARAIVRVVPSARWDEKRVMAITGKPNSLKSTDVAHRVEEEMQPHVSLDGSTNVDDEPIQPAKSKSKMRMRITQRDLDRYGYTDNCPRCRMMQDGRSS